MIEYTDRYLRERRKSMEEYKAALKAQLKDASNAALRKQLEEELRGANDPDTRARLTMQLQSMSPAARKELQRQIQQVQHKINLHRDSGRLNQAIAELQRKMTAAAKKQPHGLPGMQRQLDALLQMREQRNGIIKSMRRPQATAKAATGT